MSMVGALSADTPCHDKDLPPELCVTEARSDFGMVATGSAEATETAELGYDSQTGEFTGVGDPRRWGSAMGPRVVAVRE